MTEPHTSRVAALALVIALGLSGCAGTAAASAPEPSASTEVSLPIGFPKDVPLLEGAILHVAHPGNIWAVTIQSANLAGDLAGATALLVEAGFANTNGGDGWADFHGATRDVRIVAASDDTWGDSLTYTMTDGVPAN